MPFHSKSLTIWSLLAVEYVGRSLVGRVICIVQNRLEQTVKNFRILPEQWRYDYDDSDGPSLSHLLSRNEKQSRHLQYR